MSRTKVETSQPEITVYPFHGTYPGLPDLFHVKCSECGPIYGCSERAEMERLGVDHLRETHPVAPPTVVKEGTR